jgi:hypothetical protein
VNLESKLTDCVEDGLLGLRGDRAVWPLGELEDGDKLQEETLEQGGW